MANNKSVKAGNYVKAIGNHMWKGNVGEVIKVEDIEGDIFVHVHVPDKGTIIMREGQYEVVR